jgi:hypothetical protein
MHDGRGTRHAGRATTVRMTHGQHATQEAQPGPSMRTDADVHPCVTRTASPPREASRGTAASSARSPLSKAGSEGDSARASSCSACCSGDQSMLSASLASVSRPWWRSQTGLSAATVKRISCTTQHGCDCRLMRSAHCTICARNHWDCQPELLAADALCGNSKSADTRT